VLALKRIGRLRAVHTGIWHCPSRTTSHDWRFHVRLDLDPCGLLRGKQAEGSQRRARQRKGTSLDTNWCGRMPFNTVKLSGLTCPAAVNTPALPAAGLICSGKCFGLSIGSAQTDRVAPRWGRVERLACPLALGPRLPSRRHWHVKSPCERVGPATPALGHLQ
jgi:hypothetical protein